MVEWMEITLGDEDISKLIDHGDIDWDTSGEHDGWERAGTEAWMRKGYRDGEPVVIQKSGNPYATLKKGTMLEDLGAHIVPTAMFVDEDSLTGTAADMDYSIYQKFVSGPADDAVDADRNIIEFRERYDRMDDLTGRAVRQFAENCAAIDTAGYRPISGKSVVRDFLTEGDECYLVDFGSDLGSPADPVKQNDYALDGLSEDELVLAQRNDMRNAGYQFFEGDDTDLFEDAYDAARRDIIATYASDADIERVVDAQDMSAHEQRYLKKQVG